MHNAFNKRPYRDTPRKIGDKRVNLGGDSKILGPQNSPGGITNKTFRAGEKGVPEKDSDA